MNSERLGRTPQKYINQIYDLLEFIDQIFRNNNLQYSLAGGTLLGAIRHSGLIPWDDDADIYILENQLSVLDTIGYELASSGHQLSYQPWNLWGGLKIFHQSGECPPENNKRDYLYPSIDIFPLKKEKDKYIYKSNKAKQIWPKEFIYQREWNEIGDIYFGHLKLKGLRPDHASRYLTDAYGPDWRTHAIKTFDHRLESNIVSAGIVLDDFQPALKR